LTSATGLGILLDDCGEDLPSIDTGRLEGTSSTGVAYRITTFKPSSHLRMQWQWPDWPSHSILQVRLTAKDSNRTALTIHQEKLSDMEARELMRVYWRERIAEIENHLANQAD
jgi:hypothetical protein